MAGSMCWAMLVRTACVASCLRSWRYSRIILVIMRTIFGSFLLHKELISWKFLGVAHEVGKSVFLSRCRVVLVLATSTLRIVSCRVPSLLLVISHWVLRTRSDWSGSLVDWGWRLKGQINHGTNLLGSIEVSIRLHLSLLDHVLFGLRVIDLVMVPARIILSLLILCDQ